MGESSIDSRFTSRNVQAWMARHLEEYRDGRTGEINLTTLCEDAATEFEMNVEGGPLDDDTHWLWGVAAKLAPEREPRYGERP